MIVVDWVDKCPSRLNFLFAVVKYTAEGSATQAYPLTEITASVRREAGSVLLLYIAAEFWAALKKKDSTVFI